MTKRTKPTTEDLEKNELYRQLQEEIERLKAELSEKKTIINRAKDITPVVRPRTNRAFKFLEDVGMGLSRVADGWILECGELRRKFKRLSTTWELVTTDGLESAHIFINEPIKKRVIISLPTPTISPLIIDKGLSTDEKIKLLTSSAIALPPSMAQSLTDFSLEQITSALGYYKLAVAKGKEIKSAAGWLLKCLKEEWYKNFVPEAPAYTPKIFIAADLPSVEAVPMPANFWDKAKNNLKGLISDRAQERLDNMGVPF